MPVASEVVVRLVGKTKKFEGDMRRSTKVVGGLRKGAVGAGAGLTKMVGPLVAVAAAALSVQKVFSLFTDQLDQIDRITKTARKLDITTEALSSLEFGATQAGVSQDVLAKSLEKMLASVGEATRGMGEGKDAFEKLALSADKLKNLDADTQMGRIGEAINKLGTQAEKIDLVRKIFGRGGAALLPFIAKGSKGFAEMRKQAEKFNQTFSALDGAKVEAANDAIFRLKSVITGAARQATIVLAPAIEFFATKFAEDGLQIVDVLKGINATGRDVAKVFAFLWDTTPIVTFIRALDAAGDAISGDFESAWDKLRTIMTRTQNDVDKFFDSVDRGLDKIGTGQDTGAAAAAKLNEALTKQLGLLQRRQDALTKTPLQRALGTIQDAGGSLFGPEANQLRLGFDNLRAAEGQKAIDRLNESLKVQRDTWGKTSREIQLYQAKLEGATDAQIALTRETIRSMDASDRLDKRMQDLRTTFDQLQVQFATPLEKFQVRMEELITLFKQGLPETVFDRASLAAIRDRQGPLASSPKALERGSAAAFSAVNQSKRGNRLEKLAEQELAVIKEQLQTQRDTKGLLRRMNRILDEGLKGVPLSR